MAVLRLTKYGRKLTILCAVTILLLLFVFVSFYTTNKPNYLRRSYHPIADTDSIENAFKDNEDSTYNDPIIYKDKAVEEANIVRSGSEQLSSAELERILSCSNIISKDTYKDIHQEQSFWVLENFVQSERQFKCYESITLTTQGDFTFLDNIEVIVEKWQGPISVALYAPGDDFTATLDSIAYLRNCLSSLIKELVTFHLFFDVAHTPKLNNVTVLDSYTDYHDCNTVPYQVDHDKLYKQQKNLTYPINVARNLARRTATTHFVFPTDIELYPSPNFIQQFLGMIVNNPSLADKSPPRVFVLPLFELDETGVVPKTKNELVGMIEEKRAFVFHAHLCLKCHKIPKYKEWLEQPESSTLSVFASTKRLGYHSEWEPFFVGTNSDPWFDERLTWEGQSNKMTQGLIMCLLDYDYMVLDNAFLIHKPGIKTEKTQMQKYMKLVAGTLRLLRGQIRFELANIYGYRQGCQWFPPTPSYKSKENKKSKKKKK